MLARTYSLSLVESATFVVSAHDAVCSSLAPCSRKLASRPPASHSAAAFESCRCGPDVVPRVTDPAAKSRPRTEQRLVGDLDGRLTRRRVAVERQEAGRAERLDHAFHHSHVGQRSELRTGHAAARVYAALAERHETQEQLPTRLLLAGSFIVPEQLLRSSSQGTGDAADPPIPLERQDPVRPALRELGERVLEER